MYLFIHLLVLLSGAFFNLAYFKRIGHNKMVEFVWKFINRRVKTLGALNFHFGIEWLPERSNRGAYMNGLPNLGL